MCGFVSGILILFHWSVWLYGCTLLFWLLYVWNIFWNHRMMAAVLLFFLETTLAAWGFFCHFISILGFFSISVKNAIGICIGIEHIPLCSIQLKIKLSQRKRQKGETVVWSMHAKNGNKQEIGGCKHKHTNNYIKNKWTSWFTKGVII